MHCTLLNVYLQDRGVTVAGYRNYLLCKVCNAVSCRSWPIPSYFLSHGIVLRWMTTLFHGRHLTHNRISKIVDWLSLTIERIYCVNLLLLCIVVSCRLIQTSAVLMQLLCSEISYDCWEYQTLRRTWANCNFQMIWALYRFLDCTVSFIIAVQSQFCFLVRPTQHTDLSQVWHVPTTEHGSCLSYHIFGTLLSTINVKVKGNPLFFCYWCRNAVRSMWTAWNYIDHSSNSALYLVSATSHISLSVM